MCAVIELLELGEWEALELRIDGKLIYAPDMDEARRWALLSSVGVHIDGRSGCHMHDVMASQPHLIS